jgi:hypothetical protein
VLPVYGRLYHYLLSLWQNLGHPALLELGFGSGKHVSYPFAVKISPRGLFMQPGTLDKIVEAADEGNGRV